MASQVRKACAYSTVVEVGIGKPVPLLLLQVAYYVLPPLASSTSPCLVRSVCQDGGQTIKIVRNRRGAIVHECWIESRAWHREGTNTRICVSCRYDCGTIDGRILIVDQGQSRCTNRRVPSRIRSREGDDLCIVMRSCECITSSWRLYERSTWTVI